MCHLSHFGHSCHLRHWHRPCELHAPVCEALSLVCVAEAQALTAFRSEERGSSAAVVGALHRGAAEIWDKAAKVLRDSGGGYRGGGYGLAGLEGACTV